MSSPDLGALAGIDRIRPAYAQVASQIRDLILRGDLGPGDRLPNESLLAKQFGVSRATVREALRVLSSQGLVTTERGVAGGTFVSPGDPQTIVDLLQTGLNVLAGSNGLSVFELIECREMLEVPAAALAAERRSEADLQTLERLHAAEHDAEGSFIEYFSSHREFHMALLAAAQNRALAVILEPLFGVLETFAERVYSDELSRRRVPSEHADLLEAIRAQDADRAAEVMRTHLERLRAVYAERSP